MSRRLFKDPLVHFFLAGLCLFFLFNALSAPVDEDESKRITITPDKLIAFMQHQTKIFDPDKAQALFRALPVAKRDQLLDQYVREEALYREAKALKLDKSDYTARQRLIKQLEFVNEGFLAASIELNEDDLVRYLADNQQRYQVAEKMTFTHVFFNREKHMGKPMAVAALKLKELNDNNVSFQQALGHGDRFLYHRNYVEKSASAIASHFGREFQQQFFSAGANDQLWQGPFLSPYGAHLVLVTKLTDSFVPPLHQIVSQVQRDAIQDNMRLKLEEINREIIAKYTVDASGFDE